ncbi:hypothetical protein ACQ4PT_046874 [Festuca glaucescens]
MGHPHRASFGLTAQNPSSSPPLIRFKPIKPFGTSPLPLAGRASSRRPAAYRQPKARMAACPTATTARVGAHGGPCRLWRRSDGTPNVVAGSATPLPVGGRRSVRGTRARASELQQAPAATASGVATHKVTVHDRERGVVHEFVVPQDQYILHTAEAQDITLPFACRHGCCTSCAVRIKSGQIRQPEALGISAELREKGYALLCVGYPSSDVEVETQDEDEVYWLQFGRYFARGPIDRDDYALELAMGDE